MDKLETIYHVAMAIGPGKVAWFDKDPETHLLNQIYPVPGGALVVERMPPSYTRPELRAIDQGVFRIHRVGLDGQVRPLSKGEYRSRRGAQTRAEAVARKANKNAQKEMDKE